MGDPWYGLENQCLNYIMPALEAWPTGCTYFASKERPSFLDFFSPLFRFGLVGFGLVGRVKRRIYDAELMISPTRRMIGREEENASNERKCSQEAASKEPSRVIGP